MLTSRRTPPGHTSAAAGTLPGQLPAVAEALIAAAGDTDARIASHTALGLHTVHIGGPPAEQARTFEQWRQAVLDLGGTVLLRDRPDEVDDAVDALGPAPSAVRLLRALKSQLDPGGRCAPGRLGRWLE